jgi:hypothetical protein
MDSPTLVGTRKRPLPQRWLQAYAPGTQSNKRQDLFLGGRLCGPGAMASARNELFSYSIKENNWNLEYPYCGPAGDIQPDHPDEVGCIDTRRKVF